MDGYKEKKYRVGWIYIRNILSDIWRTIFLSSSLSAVIISERLDTDGVLAGIVVYIVAMVLLFSVITALTTDNDGTKTIGLAKMQGLCSRVTLKCISVHYSINNILACDARIGKSTFDLYTVCVRIYNTCRLCTNTLNKSFMCWKLK